jgi:tRNA (Thr-GGU) A37 N-methylase
MHRNGTPRQPLLVPAARLRVELSCAHDVLQGLEQWSHVWVLYVFHENTGV